MRVFHVKLVHNWGLKLPVTFLATYKVTWYSCHYDNFKKNYLVLSISQLWQILIMLSFSVILKVFGRTAVKSTFNFGSNLCLHLACGHSVVSIDLILVQKNPFLYIRKYQNTSCAFNFITSQLVKKQFCARTTMKSFGYDTIKISIM